MSLSAFLFQQDNDHKDTKYILRGKKKVIFRKNQIESTAYID